MTSQQSTLESLERYFEENEEQMLKDYFDFLRIPSISSEEEYKEDVLRCAHWLSDYLQKLGFEVDFWETSGHPTLFAQSLKAGPDKPTLLIYNHYDVQPVDPIEEWDSSPFEPEVRDGEVYARGAQDNKGQCTYVLQAIKGLLARDGKLPINVKLIIEGEEETGSLGLSGILEDRKEQLRSDYLAVVDVMIPGPKVPAITMGTRGICTFTLEVTGSNGDLHSGSHGGTVYNPLHALVEMLASLRDKDGRITVKDFYRDVEELSDEDRAAYNFDFDIDLYRKMFGAEPTGGEHQYTPLERAQCRPTIEINGIGGGYSGNGFKTVIPAKAVAKLSCRLVPNQDPRHIQEIVKQHLLAHTPEGVKVDIKAHPGIGQAVRSSPDSAVVKAFAKAYSEVMNAPCRYVLSGGSIPIVTELCEASKSELVLLGFGLDDDQIHAPNEHFGINRLKQGALTIARALEHLADESAD